jgi:hypothetical protein
MKSFACASRTVWIPVCLSLAASCSAPARVPDDPLAGQHEDADVVLYDGQRISGILTGRSLTVPAGANVTVEDDVWIVMSHTISIDGALVAVDQPGTSGRSQAPTIRLVARERMDITGAVRGGRGRDWPSSVEALGQAGGNGTDIIVESPIVNVTGLLKAGDGGNAGRGEPGGDGGDVIYIEGSEITGTGSCRGGHGGKAGQGTWAAHNGQGGMGGAGGGTRVARCSEL